MRRNSRPTSRRTAHGCSRQCRRSESWNERLAS
jgi:hypothetical protein